jgi:NADH:ubiquinone oxidoreductase subunit C
LELINYYFYDRNLKLCYYLFFCLLKKLNFLFFKNNSIYLFIYYYDFFFVCNFIKLSNIINFKILNDLVCVDYFSNKKNRFQFIYNFSSLLNFSRLFIIFFVKELTTLCSIKKLFFSAGWLEREIWDLFGIFFINNKDLRRILTDYGFYGFPLRKDFPLSGYLELRFDDSCSELLYEPISLAQELRFFHFSTGWEISY